MTSEVCVRCRRLISEAAMPIAVYAAEQVPVTGFSATGDTEYADGRRGWLHRGCFSEPEYRELTPPEAAA